MIHIPNHRISLESDKRVLAEKAAAAAASAAEAQKQLELAKRQVQYLRIWSIAYALPL